MEGSMEANGSVAFLSLIFQILFQTVQTQTDSKTEEITDDGGVMAVMSAVITGKVPSIPASIQIWRSHRCRSKIQVYSWVWMLIILIPTD